ncbi:MAG: hypothetical protein H7Y20_01420 [Bryobacteraceae bacterium]|nr:hypothetical protein [Bryobacteraceae bacterium]
MTNEQLYISIGVPALVNAVFFVLLMAYINAKFDGVNARFDAVNSRFDAARDTVNAKFETARSELLRVEGVLDARLSNVEQRLKVLEEKVH